MLVSGKLKEADDAVAAKIPTKRKLHTPMGCHIDYILDSHQREKPERQAIDPPMYTDENAHTDGWNIRARLRW